MPGEPWTLHTAVTQPDGTVAVTYSFGPADRQTVIFLAKSYNLAAVARIGNQLAAQPRTEPPDDA